MDIHYFASLCKRGDIKLLPPANITERQPFISPVIQGLSLFVNDMHPDKPVLGWGPFRDNRRIGNVDHIRSGFQKWRCVKIKIPRILPVILNIPNVLIPWIACEFSLNAR